MKTSNIVRVAIGASMSVDTWLGIKSGWRGKTDGTLFEITNAINN